MPSLLQLQTTVHTPLSPQAAVLPLSTGTLQVNTLAQSPRKTPCPLLQLALDVHPVPMTLQVVGCSVVTSLHAPQVPSGRQVFCADDEQYTLLEQSSSQSMTEPGTHAQVVCAQPVVEPPPESIGAEVPESGEGGAAASMTPQFSCSPWQGPQSLNSPCWVHREVPSWHAPTLRWSAGPVQHAPVVPGFGQPHPCTALPLPQQAIRHAKAA